MKKVLIITPNWPPISYPDMHRVRMALRYFSDFGYEPLILKINPEEQEGIKDYDLCHTIPDSVNVWEAGCIPKYLTGWFGLKSAGLRSFLHIAITGSTIIKKEKADLVFFSTTMFPLMVIGCYWRWRHGLPYILDFQDPWLNDNRLKNSDLPIKYRLSQWLARILEPVALRWPSHIISVSPAYVDALRLRYSWLKLEQFTVLPFGAGENDIEHLATLSIRQHHFDPSDGLIHWIYVGRGGSDMAFSIKALFLAIARKRVNFPEVFCNLRLHFIGTDYAPQNRAKKTVHPIAVECGIGDIVFENSNRIPYFEALQCLLDADALIVPGSSDPGYTASKIFPYILANKPLLAIFHKKSTVTDVLSSTNSGTLVTFDHDDNCEDISRRIESQWLNKYSQECPQTNWAAFEPFTSREMTRKLCSAFDLALSNQNGKEDNSAPC